MRDSLTSKTDLVARLEVLAEPYQSISDVVFRQACRDAAREIERLQRSLDEACEHNANFSEEYQKLRAALQRIRDTFSRAPQDYRGRAWDADDIARNALEGVAVETNARKSLPPGPARIAAQIAHATYHIIDDYGAEDAQTGDMNVEIPAHDLKEWNRVVDLLGDDPHEVLHDLIGVNDPIPSEETFSVISTKGD